MLACGLVVNFDSSAAPHLRVSLAGCTTAYGESHLLFPSCVARQKFTVRQRPPTEDMFATEDWSRIEREWAEGN